MPNVILTKQRTSLALEACTPPLRYNQSRASFMELSVECTVQARKRLKIGYLQLQWLKWRLGKLFSIYMFIFSFFSAYRANFVICCIIVFNLLSFTLAARGEMLGFLPLREDGRGGGMSILFQFWGGDEYTVSILYCTIATVNYCTTFSFLKLK